MSIYRAKINHLLKRIKNGDELKKQDLFNATYNHLNIIAFRYAIDRNDCEDILLETYVRAFKYIDSFDSNRDGYNWLCKIVQNVAYDFNNKIEVTEPYDKLLDDKVFFDDEINIENKNVLLSEISKLTHDEQKLLYLKYWEDLSYSEIALKLNSKKSTIHKQISTLVMKLKEKLQE